MEWMYPDARIGTFENGHRYEEFVMTKIKYLFGKDLHFFEGKTEQLKGENREGVEIKFDSKMKDTGNVYIETAEKSSKNKDNYFPSGIYRQDNSKWYWIGDYAKAFVFEKVVLQKVDNNEFRHVEISTSKGFLIPIKKAELLCKRYLIF